MLPRFDLLAVAGRLRPTVSAAALALAFTAATAEAGPSLVIEADTGKVLHAIDALEPWYPASLTKMMTALVVFRALDAGRITLHTPVLVSALALSQPPSKMGFPVGSGVTVEDALRILMVKSANDIAVALAEGVSGTVPAFAEEMNAVAQELGMTGTHFVNANGLPDERQYTTARDLALLARALLDPKYAAYHDLYRLPAIQFGRRILRNHNSLIARYAGATGLKTGFICASGYNVVASARRGDRQLIAVVLGARSAGHRAEIAAALLEQGFDARPDAAATPVEALQATGTPSAFPQDMRPLVCAPRKKKMTPEERQAAYAVDPSIDLERGRRALGGQVTEEGEGEGEEGAIDIAAVPVPVVRMFSPNVPDEDPDAQSEVATVEKPARRGKAAARQAAKRANVRKKTVEAAAAKPVKAMAAKPVDLRAVGDEIAKSRTSKPRARPPARGAAARQKPKAGATARRKASAAASPRKSGPTGAVKKAAAGARKKAATKTPARAKGPGTAKAGGRETHSALPARVSRHA